MAEESGLKTMLTGLALTAVTLLLCFGVMEAYLSYSYGVERDAMREKNKHRDLCSMRSPHPELIYTRVPNKCGSNSQGYRDVEHALEKPPGAFRVVLIGDSVAQGQGVDLDEAFGRVLERLLDEAAAGRDAEVITLAQSGYSTSQELFLLEHEALDYSPDIVVWSYVLNDPAHPVFHNANGEIGRYYYEPRFYTTHWLRSKLIEAMENTRHGDCGGEYHSFMHCVYADDVHRNILRIGEIAGSTGVPVLFAIHPVFERNDDYGQYTLTHVHASLAASAKEAGLDVLDLLETYRPYPPRDLMQTKNKDFDPWHPNALGNRLVAEALFAKISADSTFRDWLAAD